MTESIVIESHIPEALENKDRAVEAALEAIGMMLDYEAASELGSDPRRVDTGNLALSMEHQVDTGEKSLTVGTNVEYAIYVHEGTRVRGHEPNRFLRNAFMNNIDNIKNMLQQFLGTGT